MCLSLRASVAANFLASGWAAVMGLAFVPLYIRYLGIEAYALIGFFATLQVWLALLDMGFSATLNREMARCSADPDNAHHAGDLLRSMEIIGCVLAGSVAVLVLLASSLIARHWLNAQELAPATVQVAIALMGFIIALQWVGGLYRNGLLGLHRHLWVSAATALTATVRAIGSVAVLAFVSPTIISFFFFQLAVSAGESLLNGWHLHRSLPRAAVKPKFSWTALQRVWRFAAGLTVGAILATLLTQLDKVLLATLLPLADFGYFALTVTVAGALSIFTMPIHNVGYPRLAGMAAGGDPAAMASEYHRFAQVLSVSVIPAGLMLSFFSTEIIFLWTGDSVTTQTVAPVLTVWMVGSVLNALMHVPYMAQLAHGWTKLSVVANTIGVLLMIPALLYFVPRHGAIAAAWIWVTINAASVLLTIPVMHTRILRGEMRAWYVRDVLAPLAAATVTTLALKLLFADPSGLLPVANVVVGGLVTFAVCGLFTEAGRHAAASLVRQVLPG